ncbi:MAG: type II toxin-antitoxin system Phd/YefM family antitoxin [Ignavibacteriaceae bacterium]|jgi:PHD/YefM family antitoxin component YafN of YafNO toxin-antitoxin module
MKTYTYSEARQKLTALFEIAKNEGKVLITRKDGSVFELKALSRKRSPLEIEGINIKIKREEIIDLLKEVRERKMEKRWVTSKK